MYRILTSRFLSCLAGAENDYYKIIYDRRTDDFDPEQVVDYVTAKVVGE